MSGRVFSRVSCRLSAFTLFSLLLTLHAPAWAWNAAGHRLVAAIAWETLTDFQRNEVSRLLQHHPEFPRWQSRIDSSADFDLAIFMRAANWADTLRHDRRFFGPGEPPTPRLPGFPDMQRHANWHFQDAGNSTDGGQLYTAITLLSQQLQSQRTLSRRGYALAWLLHLVADAHQPLHNGFRPDRGGNDVPINGAALPGHPDNLHAFWDTLPEPNRLSDAEIVSLADRLLHEFPTTASTDDVDISRWQRDNLDLSRQVAYPVGTTGATPRRIVPITLPPQFIAESNAVARRQITLAGLRLGLLLQLTLNPENKTPFHVERRASPRLKPPQP